MKININYVCKNGLDQNFQKKVSKTNKFLNSLAKTNKNVYLFNAFDILCLKKN